MAGICQRCSAPHTRRQAKFCLPCAYKRTRIAAPNRRRAGEFQPLRIDGSRVCLDCHAPIRKGSGLRCDSCARLRYRAQVAASQPAIAAVAKAIKAGHLRRPSEFQCVDCGRPAEQYDHRDYSRPLDVQPVCRSCNVMRGAAVLPPKPSALAAGV